MLAEKVQSTYIIIFCQIVFFLSKINEILINQSANSHARVVLKTDANCYDVRIRVVQVQKADA